MKVYTGLRSSTRPNKMEMTPNAIYIADNVTPYEEVLDGITSSGFIYDWTEYSKDEYLIKLGQENVDLKQELLDTQLALVELYERGEYND